MDRRDFIRTGIAGGALGGASITRGEELAKTPKQTEGPFYPTVAQKDKDFDLTKIAGREDVAKGEKIEIKGVVFDTNGQPIEDASVDIWQANAAGRYSHPHDKNPAPLDPAFQGWGIVLSGSKGGFKFRTIKPGAYPATKKWDRPPHIHFKVTKKGYHELTTQMYFPDEPLNEKDGILKRQKPDKRELLVAKQVSDDPLTFEFRLVLEKV
ncbi:MAG: protocatechuate 3,4-dioxygenase subunit alpha [Akkermansiaceae bacterium]